MPIFPDGKLFFMRKYYVLLTKYIICFNGLYLVRPALSLGVKRSSACRNRHDLARHIIYN